MELREKAAIALLQNGFTLAEVAELLSVDNRAASTNEQSNHERMMHLIAQNNYLSVIGETATE